MGFLHGRGHTTNKTAFMRRSIRQGRCTTDLVDIITSIIDTADHSLFCQILTNPNVLAHLLDEKATTHYKVRPMQHDRQLILKTSILHSCNFIIRTLSTDIQRTRGFTTMRYINRLFTYFYLLTCILIDSSMCLFYFILLYKLCFVNFLINEYDDDAII